MSIERFLKVRTGYFLLDYPPRRRQFYTKRRTRPKPVIELHTAESPTDFGSGFNNGALNVANFIRNRADPGSYHIVTDRHNLVPVVPFPYVAYGDGTGSNDWVIHISVAMRAEDWAKLTDLQRKEYLEGLAVASRLASDWCVAEGLGPVPARRIITKAQSDRSDAAGFIGHGDRDPGRRSDPGKHFPWAEFLAIYEGRPTTTGGESVATNVEKLQAVLGVTRDGIIGPRTRAAMSENWCGLRSEFDTPLANMLANAPLVVQWVQHRMNQLYEAGLAEDGVFGPSTSHATKVFLKPGGVVCEDSFIWLTQPK